MGYAPLACAHLHNIVWAWRNGRGWYRFDQNELNSIFIRTQTHTRTHVAQYANMRYISFPLCFSGFFTAWQRNVTAFRCPTLWGTLNQ